MYSRDHQLRGTVLTALGVLILSPDSLLIRLVEADSLTLLFWRTLLVALTMTVAYVVIFRRGAVARFRALGRMGLLAALLFAISTFSFVMAIRLTVVANALVMVASVPLFAAILSRLFLGERAARHTWIAIAVAGAGIAVIFAGDVGVGRISGNLFGLLAAVTEAGAFVIVSHRREVDMVPAFALSAAINAVVALPLATPFALSGSDVPVLLVMGVIVLPLSFTLITIGPRYIPAAEVSLLMLLETVLAPILVWLVIGETVGTMTLVGGAVVIVTLIWHAVRSFATPGTQRG